MSASDGTGASELNGFSERTAFVYLASWYMRRMCVCVCVRIVFFALYSRRWGFIIWINNIRSLDNTLEPGKNYMHGAE